ncbi:hypothetical protein AJ88_43690 [Mesorhizobium amorphae CCBAU 01583]|nr:hypothetical protein AJ88_43690 [Mesorhizobium amorphae CCBAU 01583]
MTLAPEGGAHQSIGTPLIGIAQDGLCAFEPAFVDELAVIMRFAFDYMQRNGEGDPDETTWLRDQTGGSVYLRLSTRPLEQPHRDIGAELRATSSTVLIGCARPDRTPALSSPTRASSRRKRLPRRVFLRKTGAMSGCWRLHPLIGSMRAGRPRSVPGSAEQSPR